ncbi:MarR family transcriptional regulator [Amycolatopsis rhabdoformis]|uniref:MarR family transcriptional regulator n=1 Tax=Amycolatopsis rhabdoformis TaxID=1448059 RepID=A0ABZ1I692_9PSEU|nr:MarR family transcriptional regulator [Amycolatopsis rhabdoformis]WSE29941.1 MarR family transcriptional regulator [Amycolatopsis rhabdoformis]
MTQQARPATAEKSTRRVPDAAGNLEDMLARLQRETQLWQGFLLAHRQLVGALAEQMMRDHRLPLEWFDVMVQLADVPDMRLRQRELKDRVLLSESGVSRLLVRMERAGLVVRTPSDDDKRGVDIELTEGGRASLLAAMESHLDLVAELFTDRLTATDETALQRVVTKLVDAQVRPTED